MTVPRLFPYHIRAPGIEGLPLIVTRYRAMSTSEQGATSRMSDDVRLTHSVLKVLRFLLDRKSTRLNSSHVEISYAVLCLKKKNGHWRVFFMSSRGHGSIPLWSSRACRPHHPRTSVLNRRSNNRTSNSPGRYTSEARSTRR